MFLGELEGSQAEGSERLVELKMFLLLLKKEERKVTLSMTRAREEEARDAGDKVCGRVGPAYRKQPAATTAFSLPKITDQVSKKNGFRF